MKLELSPDAREDLRVAQDYYESQRSGLGAELLEEIETILQRVARSPLQFAVVKGSTARRARAARFPYLVIFVALPDRVRVLAVAHERQVPHWRGRS